MTKYEKLLDCADDEDICVIETYFEADSKGYCIGDIIAVRNDLTEHEKTCVLAEELGHYYTTTGNILDQSVSWNRKQEKIARKWAVNKLLKIEKLIEAVKCGCANLYDMAEYLEITVDFLIESIEVFKLRYGTCFRYENYIVTFNDIGFNVKNLLDEI